MGSCYSKNPTGTKASPENKTPKQKHQILVQNRKFSLEGLSSEKAPLTDGVNNLDNKIDSQTTRISSSENVNLQQVEHSIAPSDSGIESIGTWLEDPQGSTRSKQDRDALLKHFDHHNFSVCQDCSHLKLNDFSLVTDSPILCDSYETRIFPVIPQCEADSLQREESISTIDNLKYERDLKIFAENRKNINGTDNSELRSHLDKFSPVNKDTNSMVPTLSTKCSDVELKLSSVNKNKVSDRFAEVKNGTKAPLAQYDSLDANLNSVSTNKINRQQCLLNNIHDITESVCKCDTCSSKYCHTKSNSKYGAASEQEKFLLMSNTEAEGQLSHVNTTGQQISMSHFNQSSICYHSNIHEQPSSQTLNFASRENISSVPTNISFASHRDIKSETLTKSVCLCTDKHIPVLDETQTKHLESSVSETSSGVFTHKTVSGSLLSNGQKDTQQCSASLGSVDALITDSSSDSLVCGTEDDMFSLDLDNISKQLLESTEDVASSLNTTLTSTVDDCVIIPKDTYHQMQMDLSFFKQQLLCLSSIIQESKDLDEIIDHVQDT